MATVALAWSPSPGRAQLATESSSAILETASALYEALTSTCSDFRQRVDVGLLRRTVLSWGTMCQARPDQFEMRWSDPDGDRVVADGVHLWTYFRSVDEGQVVRSMLTASGGRFDLHREFLSDPGERYESFLEGIEEIDGRSVWVVSLRPVVASPYRSARVWIDRDQYVIRRLVIEEDAEYVRTLDFSNIRLNPSLDDSWFRFLPARGVQVIER